MMDLYTDFILDLSPIITELEFRGYVFHPMFLKEQKCLQNPYVEFPQVELPDIDSSKTELIDWSKQNKQKISQYNKIFHWIYGENFQNITSFEDRSKISKISETLDVFEESLVNFEENPTPKNFSNLQDSLEEIYEESEEYEGEFLLIILDVNDNLTKVKIQVSIESGNYLESNIIQKCNMNNILDSFDNQIENVNAEKTHLSVPITFPTYSEKSISSNPLDSELGVVLESNSEPETTQNNKVEKPKKMQRPDVPNPKKQFESGVIPRDVLCEEGLNIIYKTSDKSYACVYPKTLEKLVERGWGTYPSEMIRVEVGGCWTTTQAWKEHHINVTIFNLDEEYSIDTDDLKVYVNDKRIKSIHTSFKNDEIPPGEKISVGVMYEEGHYEDYVTQFQIVKVVGPNNSAWDFKLC